MYQVHQVRQELGKRLALEAPCPGADVVVPGMTPRRIVTLNISSHCQVPDSSFPAAIAYALATGIPFMEGLTKNRYIGRTFIQPDNRLRQRVLRLASLHRSLPPLRSPLFLGCAYLVSARV